jgi:flagellar basal-body rod modification protein FlgD
MDVSSLTQAINNPTAADSAATKLSDDLDMFLTLLTTQLQNQDPLDPMDNAEMTNQLVSFANVEQQIAQNKNLEQLINLQNASAGAAAVSYIGKDIQIDSDVTTFSGDPITFGYTPKAGAATLSINIINTDGEIIRTLEGQTSAQRHTVVWDGKDADGAAAPAGSYRFLVDAFDIDGETVKTSQTDITGRVTGSAADDADVYVLLEDLAVKLSDIISVREAASA